jgi:hypothetical protein
MVIKWLELWVDKLAKSQVENWDKNYQKVKLKIGTKITKKSS